MLNSKSKRYLSSDRDKVLFLLSIIGVFLGFVIATLDIYWFAIILWVLSLINNILVFFFPDESEGKDSGEYTEMIERLSRMTKSLSNLSVFLEREKERVTETENTLKELQKKKAELEPVVTTNRQTVDAILAAHAARGRASAWKNRIMGFSLGVLSSLVAAFIWKVFV